MIHYQQGEYICSLDNISYIIKKGFVASIRLRKYHKEVLLINGVPLLHLSDFQQHFPTLCEYVYNFFPPLEKSFHVKNNTKPIILWYRFLARHIFCQASLSSLKLCNNAFDMKHRILEWYFNKGWVIQSKKDFPYIYVKKYNKYPFTPQEINEIKPLLRFEAILLQILYAHGASMDADCAFSLMDDYCNQTISLNEFEEFVYYLHIGNIMCSKDQYERWKDKKDNTQEECCLLI